MRLAITTLLLFLLLLTTPGYSQPCTALGQTPGTAFPVCGNTIFSQTIVPLCGSFDIPNPCTVPAPYQDRNPFWYKFTCFTAGTLGFLITPINMSDDYDWQVFDITGRNPVDVFTDPSLFVACNWSELPGITGASSAGTSLVECAGIFPNMSSMPLLVQNHQYLLLVSHFTNTQIGYQLEFTGGTAVITDPLVPVTDSARATCDGMLITIHFNKKMKCTSVAADGSDFVLSPTGTLVSAAGWGCTSAFDFDSMALVLSAPLPPGTYTLTAATGTDGNTLQDHCDTEIVPGNSVTFTILAGAPLPMGTVGGTLTCAPSSVTLNFPEPILCSSIAPNGSDFIVTGPSSVTVSSVSYTCDINGQTNSITLQFSAPISASGNYQVTVTTGTDGNTLIGSCNRQINSGATA